MHRKSLKKPLKKVLEKVLKKDERRARRVLYNRGGGFEKPPPRQTEDKAALCLNTQSRFVVICKKNFEKWWKGAKAVQNVQKMVSGWTILALFP